MSRLTTRIAAFRRRFGALRNRADGPVLSSVAICMVRNEQDIIEPFLRHHAALLDLIIVLDNASTDATRAIASATARDLGNVILTDLPDRAYNQSQTMTRALQHVQSAAFADFIFFLDADEFLAAPGRAELMQALARIPAGTCALLPWQTYVPDPELTEDDHPDPLARMTLRRKTETPQYCKAVLRMGGRVDPMLTVVQGNHLIRDAYGRQLPSQVLTDLRLLHFPLRSVDQLLTKGVIGWKANIARTSASANSAYQWKRLHDIATSGQRPDAVMLAGEALVYAQSGKAGSLAEEATPAKHCINVARLYSDGSFAPAERLIAEAEAEAAAPTAASHAPFMLPRPPAGTAAKAKVSTAFHGAWHWDFLFLDEPLIRSTIERLTPDSVLDLGCGNGLYALLYRHLGVKDVLGVDGIEPEATALGPDTYRKVDLQAPFDAGRRFDLVICLEVAEHLSPAATETIFDTVARHAKTGGHILFSMAEPGQPGNGHINCRGIAEVMDLWARRGWQPDLAATLGLRAISSMSWFRRNILLLRHTGEQCETPAAKALKRIGALRYVWYSQSPGQRVTAFAEPYPDLKSGYGLLL